MITPMSLAIENKMLKDEIEKLEIEKSFIQLKSDLYSHKLSKHEFVEKECFDEDDD